MWIVHFKWHSELGGRLGRPAVRNRWQKLVACEGKLLLKSAWFEKLKHTYNLDHKYFYTFLQLRNYIRTSQNGCRITTGKSYGKKTTWLKEQYQNNTIYLWQIHRIIVIQYGRCESKNWEWSFYQKSGPQFVLKSTPSPSIQDLDWYKYEDVHYTS